jgi:Tfp pilus assembly protein PilX
MMLIAVMDAVILEIFALSVMALGMLKKRITPKENQHLMAIQHLTCESECNAELCGGCRC